MNIKEIPFDRSFASHPKSKFWSENNELKPNQVFKQSHKKYIFNCDCGHTFTAELSKIYYNNWCPYCCVPNKKLCEKENCKDCFEKSFASHPKSNFWSDKNKVNPRQISKNTHNKYIFNCNKCIHSFEISLKDLNIKNNWCSYCVNQKLCENENCKDCFEKSFASHIKSKFWSQENKLKSRNVFKNSHKKYIFNCNICSHSFESSLTNINGNNRWCPHCKHKTELKLFEWLKEKYQNVQKQVTFDWSQKKRYDFVLNNIIIELDGAQHFEQVSNWKSPEENKINDSLKNKLANDNGYRMIRICQEIVWGNLQEWEIQLINAITTENTLINIGSVYSS